VGIDFYFSDRRSILAAPEMDVVFGAVGLTADGCTASWGGIVRLPVHNRHSPAGAWANFYIFARPFAVCSGLNRQFAQWRTNSYEEGLIRTTNSY